MKQKVVIKVTMCCPRKSRTKAMKIAATCDGVEAVALKGDEKDQIEVIGEGIDTVQLAKSLRKYVGRADIVSVGPFKEVKKEEEKKPICACPQICYGYNCTKKPICEKKKPICVCPQICYGNNCTKKPICEEKKPICGEEKKCKEKKPICACPQICYGYNCRKKPICEEKKPICACPQICYGHNCPPNYYYGGGADCY